MLRQIIQILYQAAVLMIKQTEIDKISEQIERMVQLRKNSKDKSLAYQHKILQLLLQEKTTRLMNETLSAEITNLSSQKEQLNIKTVQLENKLQAEVDRYRVMETTYAEKLEETLRQMGLAKMKWLDLEEKNEELNSEAEILKQKIQQVIKENKAFKQCNEELKKQCQDYRIKTSEMAQQQADLSRSLASANLKLQTYQNKIANIEGQLSSKLTQLNHLHTINQTLRTQNEALTVKASQLLIALDKSKAYNAQYQSELHQLQQDYDLLTEKHKNLERENLVLKDRKKDIEDDAHRFELERETMAVNLKKMEKEMKKVQQELKQSLIKEQQLQEEVASGTEKIKNLDKALKKYKKEVEELKEALIAAEQTSGNQASRLKKWQVTARTQRQRICQLQQSLSVKDQQLCSLQSQFQTSEKSRFQLGFQLQKVTKEKQVLSELNLQLEERRVLVQGQREKALSQLVKQKDVYSRANFKLLQILELKEKTIRCILKAIQNGEQKVELPATFLGSQREVQELLSGSGLDKLMNPRERPKYLSEWLGRK